MQTIGVPTDLRSLGNKDVGLSFEARGVQGVVVFYDHFATQVFWCLALLHALLLRV